MMEVLTLPIWKTSTCLTLPPPALTRLRSVASRASGPTAGAVGADLLTERQHERITALFAAREQARAPARLRGRLPEPHQLHRRITIRSRRLQAAATPWIVKSPLFPAVASGYAPGRVQCWLAASVQDQIWSWVPGAADLLVSSRHLPDWGLNREPSLRGCQAWPPVLLQW
jgi:hypothetical protein